MELVYISLRAFKPAPKEALHQVLDNLAELENIIEVEVSNFYESMPLDDPSKDGGLHSVCRFRTPLDIGSVSTLIKDIQTPAVKLELLFFSSEIYNKEDVVVPRPGWKNTLNVLLPLLDLTSYVFLPTGEGTNHVEVIGIRELLMHFKNQNREMVRVLQHA